MFDHPASAFQAEMQRHPPDGQRDGEGSRALQIAAETGRRTARAVQAARSEQLLSSLGWIVARQMRARVRHARRRPCASAVLPDRAEHAGSRMQMVVLGDSLGLGFGDQIGGLAPVGWAERVAAALRVHHPDLHLTNLARYGLTTDQIAGTQVEPARALQPRLVILAAGGNDLLARTWEPERFRNSYDALLRQVMGCAAAVWTTTWHDVPRAVAMPEALGRRFSRRLEAASAIVRETSERHGACCVDFWTMPEALDSGCYSADGVHPNTRGYVRVAEKIADALCQHLGVPLLHPALHLAGEQRCLTAPSEM